MSDFDREWVDQILIRYRGSVVFRWEVRGNGSASVASTVEDSEGWSAFVEWRDTIPKQQWHEIVVEHSVSKKN
jgi:hypothetical protein